MNCNVAFKMENKQTSGSSHKRKVFLNGITRNIQDSQLASYFRQFGDIVKVYGLRDAADNSPKGFGFVEYCTTESSQRCISKSPHMVNGAVITAESYLPNK